MATFDTRALTRRPSAAEAVDLRRRAKAGEYGPPASRLATVFVFVLFAFVLGFITVMWLVISAMTRRSGLNAGPAQPLALLFPAFLLFFGLLIVWSIVRGVLGRNDWMPLALFARDNGLAFFRRSANPQYPGLLFDRGSSRMATDHFWSPTGLLADAGAYQYTTGSGENETTHNWQFIAFRLPRLMPHIVLDSHGNAVGNLPASFQRGQRVSLGDPFDSRFTLYAPAGYGPDTFRLFPPDLMARLMDAPATFDIEIVDSWMFLYSRSGLDLTSPDTWRMIEYVEGAVVARLAAVADRYSDDRVTPRPTAAEASAAWAGQLGGFGAAGQVAGGPPAAASPFVGHPGVPMVAEEGRRLRGSWLPGVIVLVIFVVIFLVFQGVFFGLVMGR